MAKHQEIELELIADDNTEAADIIWDVQLVPKASINLHDFFNRKNISEKDFVEMKSPWDIVHQNISLMLDDMELVKTDFSDHRPQEGISFSGQFPLLVHPTANMEQCFVNTTEGPVVIDENATVMQGAMLRGPIYIGKRTVVKMGATLYAGTNVGNDCIVGGEIKNTIFQAFSNKGHHGYLGDSYIGEWCNFGAGSSCSNLKNTASNLKAWSMSEGEFHAVGKKAGILMGDHVKTAINSSFNSGSVIAGFSNVFSQTSLLPKFIPPFQWGVGQDKAYDFEKMLEEIERWMQMKGQKPSEKQIQAIKSLYIQTKLP